MRPRVNYNLVKKEKKCPKRERRVYKRSHKDKAKKKTSLRVVPLIRHELLAQSSPSSILDNRL